MKGMFFLFHGYFSEKQSIGLAILARGRCAADECRTEKFQHSSGLQGVPTAGVAASAEWRGREDLAKGK